MATTPPIDPFTLRRLKQFLETFRVAQGQLPTIRDFEHGGFSEEQLKGALKADAIESFYVTLTNGTILKGYKIKQPD